jgi:hypothetical protein
MAFNIVTKTNIKNFPAYVQNSFDTPEALISAINNETDAEQLFIWSGCGFAVSSKKIREGKSIPANCIKSVNFNLIKGMGLSPRPGAKEAAEKLKAARQEWIGEEVGETEKIECPIICKDMSCLWAGNQDETKKGRCPDCGGRVE